MVKYVMTPDHAGLAQSTVAPRQNALGANRFLYNGDLPTLLRELQQAHCMWSGTAAPRPRIQ